MENNYFSKTLIIVGLILWVGLGMIVLYFQENQDIVLTWASTAGIMFILILGLETRGRKKDALEKNKENHSQLPKGEKSHKDVQGKREDALLSEDGVIPKVVDSSSHLPQSSPADNTQ